MEQITFDFQFWASAAIFVIAYILIIFDVIDRVIVALGGATLMILLRIISQESAFSEKVDYNTLVLLISMMIIVMITKKSGVFEYLAIKTVKLAKAEPIRILIFLSLITGVISALLDNVTTILLVLPLTFTVCKDLKINPLPMLISEVFASNVGGTATLIGDPPNIMIGSAVGLNFMDFIVNVTPVILIMLPITVIIFALIYKGQLKTNKASQEKVMLMNENDAITDKGLLIKCMIILVMTIIGFLLHGYLKLESGIIALAGATLLLLVSGVRTDKILEEIEWKTIFFFGGLFIMVGGIEATGIIKLIANGVIDLTGGNPFLTLIAVLWVSAIASAFIDNIPFVATMIPMIKDLGVITGMPLGPLWWALSLGACLGGNGTIIGASANVVASGMAEDFGHKITFKNYFKVAFPVMLVTIVMAMIYLVLFYT